MFAVSEGQRDTWRTETAYHGDSVVRNRKPGNKRNINSGVVSHDAEVRVLLDNGGSNLVRYAINIPNII